MNAKDDGLMPSDSGPPRPGRGTGVARIVVAGAVLGSLLGVSLGPRLVANYLPLYEARIPWQGAPPAREDWFHPRSPGEGVAVRTARAGAVLTARAPTPAGAEALARELALARLSRSPELERRREARRAEWSASLLRGPAATLSPAADCAARLRGWGEAWHALAADPAPLAEARGEEAGAPGPAPDRESAIQTGTEVVRLALATDADGLEGALQREARMASAQLFVRIGSLPRGQREVAADSWRRAWVRRAAELSAIAQALEARMRPIERELIARLAPEHALAAEPRIPDPGVILLLAASGSEPALARPMAASWALLAAAGAALGALFATPLARSAARARSARREAMARLLQGETRAALGVIPRTVSTTVDAWLQVVSGPRPRGVAGAARELAARFVARGERVLVIDGGRHLRLHDCFGVRQHLGFQECMRERLPLLGVVQSGGLAGLFVLAHGSPSRLGSWIPLGRLLDQARPHFTRAVLALEANIPRQAGEALAGRLIDGWWAASDVQSTNDARRFSARLGVALTGIEPATPEQATLEALVEGFARSARSDPAPDRTPAPRGAPAAAAARLSAPAQPSAPAPRPEFVRPAAAPSLPSAPAPAAPVPATQPALAAATVAPAPPPAREILVLDCDPQVGERLRFLIWMRRLRARSRAEVTHVG